MTLVEVIAAFAIFAMCAALMVASFTAALKLITRSVDIAGNGDAAYSQLEENSAAASGDTLTFTAGGTTYSISGKYSTYSQGDDPVVSFSEFAPAQDGVGE